MHAVQQIAHLNVFWAWGLAAPHKTGLEDQVQGVLPGATDGKALWLFGKEPAELHRGSCEANHVPGMRADVAANAVPSELIKKYIRL